MGLGKGKKNLNLRLKFLIYFAVALLVGAGFLLKAYPPNCLNQTQEQREENRAAGAALMEEMGMEQNANQESIFVFQREFNRTITFSI